MKPQTLSLRPFIGSKNYNISRSFYLKIGFTEHVISPDMAVFTMGKVSFYLQDAYVRKWIDNTMVFLEIEDLDAYCTFLQQLEITKIKGVRLSSIQENEWGREFFLHDPSGVLWHIGNFR